MKCTQRDGRNGIGLEELNNLRVSGSNPRKKNDLMKYVNSYKADGKIGLIAAQINGISL